MKIKTKNYICLVCGNEEKHATNHRGDIYCNCRKCGNGQLSIKGTKPKGIETEIKHYWFDISKPEEAEQWKQLKQARKAAGAKLFEAIGAENFKYWECLRLLKTVHLETNYVFDNQWNSSAGRLFDFYCGIVPNKKIKRGYYLELTEEHKKAREPKKYPVVVRYKGEVIGRETVEAINTGEASNIMYSKCFVEGMDIWQYTTTVHSPRKGKK